jgi:hypothetical protein
MLVAYLVTGYTLLGRDIGDAAGGVKGQLDLADVYVAVELQHAGRSLGLVSIIIPPGDGQGDDEKQKDDALDFCFHCQEYLRAYRGMVMDIC